ncbi:MAG: hypothetical protein AB8B52_02425 [Winogradskyella sp.]|uniref:hypothetical protein n=1 Tax=Winogradskyella sp. TaxID=1883156 RepID=UPI00385973EC
MKTKTIYIITLLFVGLISNQNSFAQKLPVKKIPKASISKEVKKVKKVEVGKPTSKPLENTPVKPKKNNINSNSKTKNASNTIKKASNTKGSNTISNGKLSKNKPRAKSFNTIQQKQLEINKTLAKEKGNWTLPFKSTETEANRLGRSYVGPNYKVSKNGQSWLSNDGLKQYRKAVYKPKEKKRRANFQRGVKNENGKTVWVSNAHLDIE